MSPVVTASRRRHAGKGRGPVIGAIAAIALVAVVVAIVLMDGKGEKSVTITDATPSVNRSAENDYGKQRSRTLPETAAKKDAVASLSEEDVGEAALCEDAIAATSVAEGAAEEEFVDEEAEAKASRPKTFRHPTEELLGLMMSTPPTCAMPPLPQLDPNDERLNVDALLSTTNLLVIYEDDDGKTAAWKEEVAAAKFQLAAAITNGGSVAEALTELRDYQNAGVAVRKEVIRNVNEIPDDAEACKYLEEANDALRKEDIVPIELDEVGMEVAE